MPVWVDSCGLSAVPGNPAVAGSRAQAAARGLDLSHHRASPADPDELDDCDLVLTMTTRHRQRLERAWERGRARTFTLRGLASVAPAARPGEPADGVAAHVRAVVSAADRARERGEHTPGDVEDPYGLGSAVFEQLADDIEELTDTVAAALFADVPARAGPGGGRRRDGHVR